MARSSLSFWRRWAIYSELPEDEKDWFEFWFALTGREFQSWR